MSRKSALQLNAEKVEQYGGVTKVITIQDDVLNKFDTWSFRYNRNMCTINGIKYCRTDKYLISEYRINYLIEKVKLLPDLDVTYYHYTKEEVIDILSKLLKVSNKFARTSLFATLFPQGLYGIEPLEYNYHQQKLESEIRAINELNELVKEEQ